MANFKPHPIGRFPHWADAESATETEAVGNAYTWVPSPWGWQKVTKPEYYDSSEVPSDSDSAEPVGGGVAKSDLTPEADVVGDTGAETEAVGHHGGPHHVDPKFGQTGESILKESGLDGLRESGSHTTAADSLTGAANESTGNFTSTVRRFFSQSDSVTGDPLINADTDGSPSWFHMHHDDGIMDGYLDAGADASSFDSFLLQNGSDLIAPIAEPFADAAAITDLVTGKSSPMEAAIDPLVAAGPLDAVKVDEPRNNDF